MDTANFELRQIPIRHKRYRDTVEKFLMQSGLTMDTDLECYLSIYSGDHLVGGAGYGGKVIKCVAIDDSLRGLGMTNTLMSELVKRIYDNGNSNAMLFTKPENQVLFESAGFHLVERSGMALLMESNPHALPQYLHSLSQEGEENPSAAIVMNCNPFTLGHQYLVEYAAEKCGTLHIFLVQEDKSVFPFTTRLELIKQGTAHLPNVRIHPGGDYIISSATFPTYFIKSADNAVKAQAELDLCIFGRHIAPALNIQTRFVGEEPYCPVTSAYNEMMKQVLPLLGVEVTIIPRKEWEGVAISASRVRELIRTGNLADTRELLPETTYTFMQSAEAQAIIQRIQNNSNRH